MLDTRQAEEFWKLFGNSPLFARWPEFRNEVFFRLDMISLKAGEPVFAPGAAPTCLYLVYSGTVRQTVRRPHPVSGQVWLQIEHSAGQYFGQHALFTDLASAYESSATVTADATLFRMTAEDLRFALERNPELHEALLRETLAGRLRRIPLLRSLEDNEIRWLAQVVKEETWEIDRELPSPAENGLWIVDWGQIEVTGPVSTAGGSTAGADASQPPATASKPWRLTAGNFFLTGDIPSGQACTAVTAKAHLSTHLFYLTAAHTRQLIAVFPNIRETISQPLDIVASLAGVAVAEDARLRRAAIAMGTGDAAAIEGRRLFSSPTMSAEHFQHLAQFCGWEFVPAGQNITTQGNVGHSFVILRDGMAVVLALDDRGRRRPRNTLQAGDSYGETSLLEGKPRDATVRAQRAASQANLSGPGGAEVIILDRRDLQYAIAERPELWRPHIPLVHRSAHVKETKQIYDWLDEGETVLWHDRAHLVWLLLSELGVVAGFAVVLLVLFVVWEGLRAVVPALGRPEATWLVAALILFGVIYAPFGILVAFNYYLDYYAVTTRRVTRRDFQWLAYQFRTEAPIEMVQDVSVAANLMGWFFNFGELTVRTAAKVGPIEFTHVPDPDSVKELILKGKAEAVAAQRGQQKEFLRRGVIGELRLALPIPQRSRPLGEDVRPPSRWRWLDRVWRAMTREGAKRQELLPAAGRVQRWKLRLVWPVTGGWPKLMISTPAPQPLPGQMVWRKHPVNLLQRAGIPALIVLLWVAVLIVAIHLGLLRSSPLGINGVSWLLAWGVLFAPALFWLWYRWADWHNDIYVVTDDKLIDIERKPLSLSTQRREGNLDRVQTVYAEQKGLWANLLGYGDVIILTAAADPGFTFNMVPGPKHVQALIFRKLDAFRRKQEERDTEKRRQELVEGLQIYHQLREEQRARETGIR
jgi:CRP-like cAMP-binding protein